MYFSSYSFYYKERARAGVHPLEMMETKVLSITTSFKLVEGKVEVLAASYFVAMEGFLLTEERKTLFRYHTYRNELHLQ